MFKLKCIFYILCFLSVSCFKDIELERRELYKSSKFSSFSGGTYNGTQWDGGNSWIENDGTHLYALPDGSVSTEWTDMSSNLLLMHFDEASMIHGGTITSSSQFPITGTIQTGDGSTNKTTTGKLNSAMSFDGDDDRIILGNPAVLDTITDSFTFEAWAFATGDDNYNTIGSRYGGGADLGWWFEREGGADKISFAISTDGSSWNIARGASNSFELNQWYHFVATYDGVTMRAYINGEEHLGGDFPKALTGSMYLTAGSTYIGSIGSSEHFEGKIDEVAIYNTALSPATIRNHYLKMAPSFSGHFDSAIFDSTNAGGNWGNLSWIPNRPYGKDLLNNAAVENIYPFGNIDMTNNVLLLHMNETSWSGSLDEVVDSSGALNHGNINGSPVPVAEGKFSRAGKFNGTDQHIEVADIATTAQITVSVWAWRDPSDQDSASWPGVFSKWDSGQYEWHIGQQNGDISMWAVINGSSRSHDTATPFPKGEWAHLAFTYDGANFIGYVNGAVLFTEAYAGAIDDGTSPITIGVNLDTSAYFKGLVDEASIWQRSFSATEISDLYKRGALKLKAQVRACATADCAGVEFKGPSGDSSLFFSESSNRDNAFPFIDTANAAVFGQYFQYRYYFESYDSALNTELKSVEISTAP